MMKSIRRRFFQGASAAVLVIFGQGTLALAPDTSWFVPDTKESTTTLAEQRYHYELAKSALEKKRLAEYQKHYALLGDYPLVPYLDYTQLKQSLHQLPFDEIDKFLATNEDTFLAFRVREQVLHILASRKRWTEFDKYYRPDMNQKALQCFHLYSRIAQGDQTAYNEVALIWSEGKSQPTACNPLFDKWRKNGGLTDEIAWKRFNDAMKHNRASLARFVSKVMNAESRAYAERYLDVHANPHRVKDLRQFAEQSLRNQEIISHGIKRLAVKDPLNTLKLWERYEAQQLFPQEISVDTKVFLANRLALKDYTAEAEALIQQSAELRQTEVLERLAREALRNQDYTKVLQWISYMDAAAQASDRWQYWRARAQDELNITETDLPSTQIYEALSTRRSFYGFLAADILKREYALEDNPGVITMSTTLIVQNMPALKRTKELWLKGNFSEAQAEWQYATRLMSPRELAAAGRIAQKWGWYNKAIMAMISGNVWDDLDVRFPLAYRETVEQVSSKTKVDSILIYAIARQESAFAEKARSSAGALGLMQIMPGTARQTARKTGIKHEDRYLLDPEYNINLGSHYLNELLKQFKGNRILAAAAYNAGPHRVNTWIKRTPLNVPYDVWIESIPFSETRGYVQNVLAFSVIYAYRMGQPGELITPNETQHASN